MSPLLADSRTDDA